MAMKISILSVLISCLVFVSFNRLCLGLDPKFYSSSCSDVENIVFRVVNEMYSKNTTIAPALIRLYFHDCFSGGCDASLLLDGPNSEKLAPPNLSVRGYDVIEAVKTEVEKACRGVVSCADIIALATRDLVTLSSGGKTRYEIPLGRFDSKQPSPVDLPSPSMTVSETAAKFKLRGLDPTDMVIILGAHTIGVTHCPFVYDRLYNHQNTNKPDPLMDPNLWNELKDICPKDPKTNNAVNLDQNPSSSNFFDVSFFTQISLRRGILQIDQAIAADRLTKTTVAQIAANGNDFLKRFGDVMVKLGFFGIKGKLEGEVRTTCSSPKKQSLRVPILP